MTYLEIIRNTYQDRDGWNYYSDQDFPENIESPEECKQFVRVFFSKSGKAGCLTDIVPNWRAIPEERWMHIVFTFFIGVFFYENNEKIKKSVDKQLGGLSKRIHPVSDVKFQFVWFLICLFHDLGYVIESAKQHRCKFDNRKNKIGRLSGVPMFFSRKLYVLYEKNIHPNDHGICGGISMFDELCEVRKWQEGFQQQNRFLSWDKTLIPYYRLAASVVICHNMWFVNEDENEVEAKAYKSIGLQGLVKRTGVYKIDLQKYPLFFLFCLVDAVEPIKRVKDIKMLDKISLSLDVDMIAISLDDKCPRLEDYLDRIGLDSWLTPSYREDDRIIIEIK